MLAIFDTYPLVHSRPVTFAAVKTPRTSCRQRKHQDVVTRPRFSFSHPCLPTLGICLSIDNSNRSSWSLDRLSDQKKGLPMNCGHQPTLLPGRRRRWRWWRWWRRRRLARLQRSMLTIFWVVQKGKPHFVVGGKCQKFVGVCLKGSQPLLLWDGGLLLRSVQPSFVSNTRFKRD